MTDFCRLQGEQRGQTDRRGRAPDPVLLGAFGVGLAVFATIRIRAQARPQVSLHAALPLAFEVNQGQANPRVKFLARGGGYTAFLTTDGALIALSRGRAGRHAARPPVGRLPHHQRRTSTRSVLLRLEEEGRNASSLLRGVEPLPAKSNYLIGNDAAHWIKGVPTCAKVECKNAYPGIDIVYYGAKRQLEFGFVVSPGADLRAVNLKIAVNGSPAEMHADPHGELAVGTAAGIVKLRRPKVYQGTGDGEQSKRLLNTHYVIGTNGQVSFNVTGTTARSRS